MLTPEDTVRLHQIHQRLIAATYREIKKDSHHKSSEASMTLMMHLPNAFNQERGISWRVEAYSYLLNQDESLSSWDGRTAAEAIAKAEDAISVWVMASEYEEFDRFMRNSEDDPEVGQ